MNYYPIESDINTTISNATSADFVYLPEGTITTPITINNVCTVIGQGTIVDVRGLAIQNAISISEDADIQSIEAINDTTTGYSAFSVISASPTMTNLRGTGDLAFKIDSCNGLEAENLEAENSNTGYHIENSLNLILDGIEAINCSLGMNLEGSSSIIGDAYGNQEFGLNILSTNISSLPDYTTFYFTVNGVEYQLTTTTNTTYQNIVQLMNNAQRVGGGDSFPVDYNASIVNGDIRVTALQTGGNVALGRGTTGNDLFYHLIDKNEVITITCTGAGNFSGVNLSGKYWTFSTHTDDYVVWYQVNGAGAAPVIAGTPIEIDVAANDTADVVATKTDADISVLPGITTTVTNNILSITIDQKGDVTDAADGDTGFSFSISQGEIGSFDTAAPGENQALRTDRSHDNTFTNVNIHDCGIGIRLINADNNNFEMSKVFSNTNIGVWQMPTSYNNKFRGEIFNNVNYGLRNTDKTGNLHTFDAASTWWGHITGPSGAGPGQGDKVSNYSIYEPWSRSGTEPILPYPVTRDWIWTMLGDPIVRVELTEKHISDAIDMAIDRYMYYRYPERMYEYIDVGSATTEVILPAHITKESVIDVTYSPHSQLFQQLTGAGEAFFLTYYLQQTGGTFASDFYIAMAYKETMERSLGIVPSYEFVSHDDGTGNMRDFIRIYPKPSIGLKVAILYARPMTEEEIDSSTWIRKYALTWAKEQLGRIRSKFASVPGPTGEAQLDGQQLISEAQQEREQLEQSAVNRGEPLSFTMG